MTDNQHRLISELVAEARQQNRRLIRARQAGFRFPLAAYQRSQAMGEARAIKGVPPRHRGAALQGTLCELADLACEIDHRKNHLPAIYRPVFIGVVEHAHSQVKAIADEHGVVVYADQQEKMDRDQSKH